jgi:hypothetical protein
MRIMNATALSDFARKAAESATSFASVVHNLIMDVRGSYRPELHYMRGPGPKWRARQQPWQASALAKIDFESVPLEGRYQLSPVYVRRRDAAHRTR